MQPDGGIYVPESGHKNYETCIAMLAFAAANGDGRYGTLLKKGDAFLKGLQWDESNGTAKDNVVYGGAGYGGEQAARPLEHRLSASRPCERPAPAPTIEAMKKALVFVSRCQNLESEFNDRALAARSTTAASSTPSPTAAQSMAGKTRRRRPALLRLHDLRRTQEHDLRRPQARRPPRQGGRRVHQQHYSLDENPGMGEAGLYYYYHTFAKALAALGQDTIVDARARATTGATSWSRPSPTVNSPTARG